jgi:hypothetical protein
VAVKNELAGGVVQPAATGSPAEICPTPSLDLPKMVSTVLVNAVDNVLKEVFTVGLAAETTRRMVVIRWQIVPLRDRVRRWRCWGSACCWPAQVPWLGQWSRVDNGRHLAQLRDLVRAREDARADLMRVRHRLSKLLLRQGIVYYGGTPWTYAHEEWLRRHRFDDVHLKAAFDHSFDAVLSATAARDRLDQQITVVAASPRFADPVNRLGCLRGISALTGLALTVESGKNPLVANVAVARELAGWCWSLATMQ